MNGRYKQENYCEYIRNLCQKMFDSKLDVWHITENHLQAVLG